MKAILFTLIVFVSSPAIANQLQKRETTCNARYNNFGIVSQDVNCTAWFDSSRRLYRVRWFYPQTKKYYDFSTKNRAVSQDPRWKECVRYTFEEGNQWQLCTVPSPDQLNIK